MISPSQLQTWHDCRLKWHYSYQRNIKLPTQAPQLASGTTIHEVLENVLGGTIELEDVPAFAEATLQAEFEHQDDSQRQVDRYLPGVLRALGRVPTWVYEETDWHIEEPIEWEWTLPDGLHTTIEIGGIPDMYRVTDEGVFLVEIKSSTKPKDLVPYLLYNPQHRYYGVILRKMYPDLPIFVQYIVTTTAQGKHEAKTHDPFLLKDKLLDSTERLMLQLASEVGHGDILPHYSWTCGFCDFEKICAGAVQGLQSEEDIIKEFYVERREK